MQPENPSLTDYRLHRSRARQADRRGGLRPTGRPQLTATTSASRRPNHDSTAADTHSRPAAEPRRRLLLHRLAIPWEALPPLRRPSSAIASPVLRPLVHRLPRTVHMPKIPRRPRNDRPATPRTHRRTSIHHPFPTLSQLLVTPPVPLRRCLAFRHHLALSAKSGRDFLTARVSGRPCLKKPGTISTALQQKPQCGMLGGEAACRGRLIVLGQVRGDDAGSEASHDWRIELGTGSNVSGCRDGRDGDGRL
jgi:hypothetical protein